MNVEGFLAILNVGIFILQHFFAFLAAFAVKNVFADESRPSVIARTRFAGSPKRPISRSNDIIFPDLTTFLEPGQVEHRNVLAVGLPVQDAFGH